VASEPEAETIRALLVKLGPSETHVRLSLGRATVERLVARLPVHAGTIFRARLALANVNFDEEPEVRP
jgi:hypothetical protein